MEHTSLDQRIDALVKKIEAAEAAAPNWAAVFDDIISIGDDLKSTAYPNKETEDAARLRFQEAAQRAKKQAAAQEGKTQVAVEEIVLRNQTPKRLGIAEKGRADVSLVIPPFGVIMLSKARAETLAIEPWESRGILSVKETQADEPLRYIGMPPFMIIFYGALVWGGWKIFGQPPSNYWLIIIIMSLIAAMIGFAVYKNKVGELPLTDLIQRATRLSALLVTVLVAVAISVGLPLLAVLAGFAIDRPDANPWLCSTDKPCVNYLQFLVDEHPDVILGRFLQVLLIATLGILPAILYFLFDRQKLSGVRERFFRSILMIHPNLRTLKDAEAAYSLRALELLGSSQRRSAGSPIAAPRQGVLIVATVVTTLGWILALNPLSEVSRSTVDGLLPYVQPSANPLVYAFFGAYVFSIWMLLRRYARSDLKPEAYASVVIRMIAAILIAWTVAAIPLPGDPKPDGILAVAFIIGFFPDFGLAMIAEYVRTRPSAKDTMPALYERLPLDRLDGVNLFHRTRLMDEGIENLENLAHCDLIELMLSTRFPLGTLVDWIDQSILYLHVLGGKKDQGDADLDLLRCHGIRSASDLEGCYRAAQRCQSEEAFLKILGPAQEMPRLGVIRWALADDEWMQAIRSYRASADEGVQVMTVGDLDAWDRGELEMPCPPPGLRQARA